MKLSTFLAIKPPQSRIGQWFYNCYLHNIARTAGTQRDATLEQMEQLYYQEDEKLALHAILRIMDNYCWDVLPDLHQVDTSDRKGWLNE